MEKRITQFWDGQLPEDIKPLTQSWQEANPDFEYHIFNKADALSFFENHFDEKLVNIIKRIQIPAMFSDVFRVAVIKKLGGLYVDCGTQCISSINDFLKDDNKCTLIRKHNGWIWNGFIYAPKDHPTVNKIWENIEKNLLSETDGNIWALTGPKVFMDTICPEYPVKDLIHTETKHLESDNLSFLEQNKIKKHFNIINKLSHKGPSHWSKLQTIVNLYKPKIAIEQNLEAINKELIIHIGQHKTGSTSLQQALYQKQKTTECDFYYPETGLKGTGHHGLSDLLSSNNKEIIKSTLCELHNEIKNCDKDKVIISSEYLSAKNELEFNKQRMNKIWFNLSLFSSLFKKTTIIYYTRNQVKSIESRINQSIKSRLCLNEINLDTFIRNPTLNYSVFGAAIKFYFKHANLLALDFDNEKNNLISNFSSVINIKTLPSLTSNKSITSFDSIMKMLEVNKSNISIDDKMMQKNYIMKNESSHKNTSGNILDDIQIQKIIEHFKIQ